MSAGTSNVKINRPAWGDPSVYVARDGVVIRLHAIGRGGNHLGDIETLGLTSYDDMISLAADLLDAAVKYRRQQESMAAFLERERAIPTSLDDDDDDPRNEVLNG